jgi:hypothetical protein
MHKVAFFHTTPGFCDEAMHVFRATGLEPSKAKGDDDERIEVRAFPLETLQAMVDRGEIREGKTLVAILMEVRARAGGRLTARTPARVPGRAVRARGRPTRPGAKPRTATRRKSKR